MFVDLALHLAAVHQVATVGSIAMSSQAYLRIIVGVALGMAFLGETPSTHAWVGLALVVAGVVAMTWPSR